MAHVYVWWWCIASIFLFARCASQLFKNMRRERPKRSESPSQLNML